MELLTVAGSQPRHGLDRAIDGPMIGTGGGELRGPEVMDFGLRIGLAGRDRVELLRCTFWNSSSAKRGRNKT